MSKSWLRSKQEFFVRDVLHDFCHVASILEQHFTEYDASGTVSFHFFDDLLGLENSKGLLWRLKDTAHLLFRNELNPRHQVLGEYLDWALGYIFHECIKLKEDAYQQMNYRPRFKNLQAIQGLSPEEQHIGAELYGIIEQTNESIAREVRRVRFILFHCKRMFILYLPAHSQNSLLARFFHTRQELVQRVFKGFFDELLQAVYPQGLHHMYILAAKSFAQGGWTKEAQAVLALAGQVNENHELGLEIIHQDANFDAQCFVST